MINLLNTDGDVTVTNKDGDTPLYLATFKCAGSSCSDFRLIQTLISVGKTKPIEEQYLKGRYMFVNYSKQILT